MLAGPYHHENRELEADFALIQKRYATVDIPLSLELLEAAPTWRCRETYPLRNLSYR